jgi:transposase InsO family protein
VISAKKVEIGERVSEVFFAHRRRYGARRIAAQLKDEGLVSTGRFSVRSQMRRLGLRALAPRRFRPQTTDSRHTVQASPNLLLEAANAPQQPGEVIVGDITYLPTRSGRWSYLASWQDKFTKRIVGWAVDDSMTEELVIKAFERALAGGAIRAGTIIHSDRGSQYVAKSFRALLTGHGCRPLPCHGSLIVTITPRPRVSFHASKPSY